jgi:hypothetical protein
MSTNRDESGTCKREKVLFHVSSFLFSTRLYSITILVLFPVELCRNRRRRTKERSPACLCYPGNFIHSSKISNKIPLSSLFPRFFLFISPKRIIAS